MIIYTGNTLRHRIKPNADVACTVNHVLENWKQSTGQTLPTSVAGVDHREPIPSPDFFNSNSEDGESAPSNPTELTVKLFLPTGVCEKVARDGISGALESYTALKQPNIHNLILSLQGVAFEDETEQDSTVNDECIFSIWKSLTSAVEATNVENFGISELSTTRLQSLLTKIDDNNKSHPEQQIPLPTIDHINATDCCALPPSLISLSKQRGVKLLAHHDPQDLLPKREIQELGITDGDWDWIMRLTYIVKDRQVLSGNEYLISIS